MWSLSSSHTSGKKSHRRVKLLFYAQKRSAERRTARFHRVPLPKDENKTSVPLKKVKQGYLGADPIHSHRLFVDYLLWKAWLECLYCLSPPCFWPMKVYEAPLTQSCALKMSSPPLVQSALCLWTPSDAGQVEYVRRLRTTAPVCVWEREREREGWREGGREGREDRGLHIDALEPHSFHTEQVVKRTPLFLTPSLPHPLE